MNEIWKDITDYEGLYQVSNYGNVKSLNYNHTGKEKILKLCLRKDGYMEVKLYKNGKYKWFKIHRLVAMAFIPNPNNLPQVNHINEDKSDNRVENLEFCTAKYNMDYNEGQKRRAKKRSKTVCQYTMDGEFIKEYPSTMVLNKQFDYNNGAISQCCNGKRKTAYGYKWRYKK